MARTKANCNTKAAVKAPRKVAALSGRAPNVKAAKASKYSGRNAYRPRSTPDWQKPITSFFSKDLLGECSSSKAEEVEPAHTACDEDPKSSGNIDGGILDPSNEEPKKSPSSGDDVKNDGDDDSFSDEFYDDTDEKNATEASEYSEFNAYFPRPTPDWQKPITSFFSKDSLGECSSSKAEEVKPAHIACDEDPKSSGNIDGGILDPSNEEPKKSPSSGDDEKNDGDEPCFSDYDYASPPRGYESPQSAGSNDDGGILDPFNEEPKKSSSNGDDEKNDDESVFGDESVFDDGYEDIMSSDDWVMTDLSESDSDDYDTEENWW